MPQYQGVWSLQQQMQALTSGQWATDPLFDYTTLLLQADSAANGAQNNTFLDSSTNAFAITRNGNTTQGTFSPFSATGWSGFFGTGNYLNSTFNQAFTGTTNFCFETWMYLTAMPTQDQFWFLSVQSGVFCDSWVDSSLNVGVRISSSTGTTLTSTSKVTLNSWNHVAVAFDGTTLRIFINGVPSGSTSFTMFTGTTTRYVVAYNDYVVDPRYFTGYLSNWRVSVGTPRYTAAFTPSPTPFVADANTIILLLQSNRFNDTSGNNRTIVSTGTPSVQAFSPFAPQFQYTASGTGGSGYFDGSGDYLTLADNVAFEPGTGDFTIEAWVYHTTAAGSLGVYIAHTSSGISFYRNASGKLEFAQDAVAALITSTNNVPVNAWTQVAVTRSGTTLKLFMNGAQEASVTNSTNLAGTGSLGIGASAAGTNPFTGYISGLRMLKGTGYSSISIPTAPPTAITNTSLLTNFTNAGILDGTMKNAIETVGNAAVNTSVVKYGSGSMYFDGTGDYITTAPRASNILGNGDFTVEFWAYPSNTSSAYRALVSSENYASTAGGWSIYQNGTSIEIWLTTSGKLIDATSALASSTWQHIALSRASGTLRLFVNGTSVGSASNSVEWTGQQIYVGDNNYSGIDYFYIGYIDDLRITKGIARYTQNFIPPSVALPRQ